MHFHEQNAYFRFQFNISRTLSQSAAAWLATKQAGSLNDLKRETEEEAVSEKKTILVIRIGGTSASGEYYFELKRLPFVPLYFGKPVYLTFSRDTFGGL